MFKTKARVIFTLTIVSVALCMALTFVQSWLLAVLLGGVLIAILALMSSYKSETPPPIQKQGKMFRSSLVQADFHQKSCKITVCEDEIVVTSRGIPDIHIGYDRINTLLYQDKSTKDTAMVGFSIDYDRNTRRLMFLDTRMLAAIHVPNVLDAIKAAHAKATNAPLNYIDVGRLEKQAATELVHKLV